MARAGLSNNRKRKIRQLLGEGADAFWRSDYPHAERCATQVLAMDPENADALNILALIIARLGDRNSAIALLQKAHALHPRHAQTLQNLASMYVDAREYVQAAEYFRLYTEAMPEDARGWCALSGASFEAKDLRTAEMAARKALELDPDQAEAMINLANVKREMMQTEGVLELMDRAVALEPENANARFNYGLALVEQGRMQEGEAQLRACLRLDPKHAPAWRILIDANMPKEYNDDVRTMERLHAEGGLDDDNRSMLAFALGKVWEKLKDYDKAFAFYEEGNRLHRKSFDYNVEDDARDVEEICSFFTKEFFAEHEGFGFEDETPVFVVGMPRSGSTLVEQILSSHPEVSGAGESGLFRNVLTSRLSDGSGRMNLSRLAAMDADGVRWIGETYVRVMREVFPDSPRITDKALPNLWLIGAMHLALPKARIIHCRRNPMDNCLSIYANRFVGYLFRFAYDQQELGQHYLLYQRMMQHWRQTLSPEIFYEISYEELVADPESEVRRLLEFCGLDWHEDCLAFHKARRQVRTTSVAQVRQPIYRSSVERWRRFEAHLGPLCRVLGVDVDDESEEKTKVA